MLDGLDHPAANASGVPEGTARIVPQPGGESNGGRYSIAQTPTGEKFVLLDRPNKIDWNDRDKVREYLTTLVGTGAVSLADNQRIEIGKELPDEYTRSRYAEKAFRNVRLRKVRGKTAQHLDELIAVSGERTAEPSKHKKREGGVYYRRAVNFGVLGHEVKRGYSAELISYEKNGKEYLYDLVNIKDNPSLVPDSATGGNGGFESLSTYNGEGSTARIIPQTGAPAQGGRFSIAGQQGAANMGIKGAGDAEAMEKAGKDREEIWRTTGWWRGKDGKWRVEIPDFTLNFETLEATGNDPDYFVRKRKLSDVISDTRLFEAYPALKKITVETPHSDSFGQDYLSMQGVFDGKRRIKLNMTAMDYDPAKVRATLAHEIQHAIQAIEGFAKGGNEGQFKAVDVRKMRSKAKSERRKGNEEEAARLEAEAEELEENGLDGMVVEDYKGYMDPFEAYQSLTGETEARNVEKRLGMTPEERAATPPWATEDVQEDRQIVRYSIVSLAGRDVAVVDDLDAAREMNPTMPADVEKYILDHLEDGIQMLVGGTASINAETARHFAWSKVRGKYNKSRRMRKARAQSAIVFGDLVKIFKADDTTKQEDYHKQGDEVWKCRLPFGVPQFGNSSEKVAGGVVYDADVIVKDEGGGKFLYDVANLKRNEALTQQLTSQAQDLFGGGKRAAEAVSARAPSAPEGTARIIPDGADGIKEDPESFARRSIRSFADGTPFVEVDNVPEEIRNETNPDALRSKVEELIRSRWMNRIIDPQGVRAFVNGRTAHEYVKPAKPIDGDELRAKMNAAGNLDEVVATSGNARAVPDGQDGHVHENVKGWEYRDAIFKVDGRFWACKVNIAILDKVAGKQGDFRKLHDLTGLKEITDEVWRLHGNPVEDGQSYPSNIGETARIIPDAADGIKGDPEEFARRSIAARATEGAALPGGRFQGTGFFRLTSCSENRCFAGVLRVPKKLEKSSPHPLAPGGPFWYITHPLRPKGPCPAARFGL